MSILIKGIPLGGYEISIMKDGERYRARVDGIWCEVEEIQTTEPDADTISRAKAIEAIKAARVEDDGTYQWRTQRNLDLEFAEELLETIPPAQPERIKSKWALHTYMPHNKFCLVCRNDSPYNKRWDFCPNCGAEMEVTT